MATAIDFTNASIDAIKPPVKGRTEYRDKKNPALVLRVTARGAKTFSVARKMNGKFVRVTLGTYKAAGDAHARMTVEMARKALRKAEGKIAEGVNVTAERRATRRAGNTVADWLRLYLSENSLKPRTQADYQEVLREFCPDWLNRPLTNITREHLKARHKRHGAERSQARANNAIRVLRALYNFAGIAPNPASSPKRKRAGEAGAFLFADRRKRTRIHDADMPAWWASVSGLSGRRADSGARDASHLLTTLLLTGLRAREACALEWEFVDVRAGVIEIPDTKNHDPHLLPVGNLLRSIIEERRQTGSGRYVFGSKADADEPYSYSTLRGWFEVVAAESGVKVTAHDCRRTFASVADSLDISGSTVKRLLNHRTGRRDVTEGYIVPSPERLRGAMQRIEDRVLELAGNGNKPGVSR